LWTRSLRSRFFVGRRRTVRGDDAFVDDVAGCPVVADCAGERVGEQALEPRHFALAGKFDRTRRVRDRLQRLDVGQVVEKPRAARIHQKRMALHVEKLERAQLVGLAERAARFAIEEDVLDARRAPDEDYDETVARTPRVFEQLAALAFEDRCEKVAQQIERFTERSAPALVSLAASARAS